MNIQGHEFWGQWKGDEGLNNATYVGLSSKGSEAIASESTENRTFSSVPLSFDAASPGSHRHQGGSTLGQGARAPDSLVPQIQKLAGKKIKRFKMPIFPF